MKKIAILFGTRPEAIKLIPLYLEFKRNESFDPVLIFSGQHKDLVNEVLNLFKVEPDFELATMKPGQSLSFLTSNLFRELEELFLKAEFNGIVVQGDTTSAFVGAMVGFYNKIKVIHVEAGLRTYNKYSPFPEEINRQLIGKIANYHFAPTSKALENLKREKIEGHLTGNTGIDALELIKSHFNDSKKSYERIFDFLDYDKEIVLVTAHRRENHGEGMKSICRAIIELADAYPAIQFVYPVHPNPSVKDVVFECLSGINNIHLFKPLPYDQLLFLISRSKIILSDSGGIQEEAPSFNVPLLVLRDTSERPEGIEAGCAKLVGTSYESIVNSFNEIYTNEKTYSLMTGVENPYGDGKASKRIVDILKADG